MSRKNPQVGEMFTLVADAVTLKKGDMIRLRGVEVRRKYTIYLAELVRRD